MPDPNIASASPIGPDIAGYLAGNSPAAPTTAQQPGAADGGNVRQQVAALWKQAGYSDAATAGIMRRVNAESGFDPHAIGDGGTSFGLYQHHADRAAALHDWAKSQGLDPGDPLVQTKFAIREMTTDPIAAKARDRLMHESDPLAAYGLFTASFERPKHAPGSEETNLAQTATGSFNAPAQAMLARWQTDLNARGKQYDEALRNAHDLGGAEQAALLKWQAASDKPPANAHQAWRQWFAPAMMLAALGGLGGRNMTAGISAAGAMLQGANAADAASYKQNYQLWRDHQDDGLRIITLLHQQARDTIDDARKSYDEKVSELSTLSSVYSLTQKLDPSSVDNIGKNLKILKDRADLLKAQNTTTETNAAVDEKDQAWLKDHPEAGGKVPADIHASNVGAVHREMSGTVARLPLPREVQITDAAGKTLQTGAAYQDASGNWLWAATNQPIAVPPGGVMNLKSVSQPRSAIGLATQKYIDEHPNSTAADISQFNAEFTRLAALDRDFASGPEGRNLISLNTVADHLPLFRQYAAAIQNGDTRAANSLLNSIQRQTGHPEITNFDLARDFLADEVARVLVPGGAGSAGDREEMKSRLEAGMSEQQLAGGADTATQFIKGKLSSLRQQYSRGDADRGSYFDKSMLTPDARSLFGQAGAKPGGQHHFGEIITAPNGKRYRVTGGDMSDPDVEPVQ